MLQEVFPVDHFYPSCSEVRETMRADVIYFTFRVTDKIPEMLGGIDEEDSRSMMSSITENLSEVFE